MTEIPDAERKSKDGGGSETVARTVLSGEQVSRLLNTNPAEAEVRAREAIAQQPENPGARWLLGAARRRQGDAAGAKEIFQSLVESHPQMVAARFELGLSLRDSGAREAATAVLLETVDLAPNYAAAWYALGDQLDLNDKIPSNIKLRADTAFHAGRYAEAEANLTRCFESAPDSKTARFQYAVLLLVQRRGREALQQIEHLLKEDSSNFICLQLKVTALSEIEEFEHAIPDYENILKDADRLPGTWLAYGRALRALGRYEQAIAAWRRAIEIFPGFVDAYWSLATIKTFRFDAALTDLLRGLLLRSDLPSKDRAQLHFALGKVLEDEKKYAESFDNYQKSHALQQSGSRRTNEMDASFVRRAKAVFSKEFFRERADAGCPARAPIFIVGLPRSGSTLVEQILSAHSAIEGIGELPDLKSIVAQLDDGKTIGRRRYPEMLGALNRDQYKSLGEEYLQRTRPRRKQDLPFFTDKFPGNFAHIGLLHLILPDAKIIDVRRHPLDCCLSNFKSYFPQSQTHYHTLEELGRHYSNYVESMAHFDEILPGKIHRLIYEQLIDDPASQVRRLFDYLNLPFEDACLRFHEKDRAITTLSSEQVRQPLYHSGVGYWRNFEPWLGPLKQSLGPILDLYPKVPEYLPQLTMTVRLV